MVIWHYVFVTIDSNNPLISARISGEINLLFVRFRPAFEDFGRDLQCNEQISSKMECSSSKILFEVTFSKVASSCIDAQIFVGSFECFIDKQKA